MPRLAWLHLRSIALRALDTAQPALVLLQGDLGASVGALLFELAYFARRRGDDVAICDLADGTFRPLTMRASPGADEPWQRYLSTPRLINNEDIVDSFGPRDPGAVARSLASVAGALDLAHYLRVAPGENAHSPLLCFFGDEADRFDTVRALVALQSRPDARQVIVLATSPAVAELSSLTFHHLRWFHTVDAPLLCDDDLIHGPNPMRPDVAAYMLRNTDRAPYSVRRYFGELQQDRSITFDAQVGQWEFGPVAPRSPDRPFDTAYQQSIADAALARLVLGGGEAPVDERRDDDVDPDDPQTDALVTLALDPMVEANPDWADELCDRAWERLEAADPAAARTMIDAASLVLQRLDHAPEVLWFKLYRYWAVVEISMGELVRARMQLVVALKAATGILAPNRTLRISIAGAREELGWVTARLGDSDAAAIEYRRAVAIMDELFDGGRDARATPDELEQIERVLDRLAHRLRALAMSTPRP